MRLKSLKLKGFKSFADETVIQFDQDVIGIVGPNGSGKSNIVDAIRWVLGEQKGRELRLENMGDVLFNGTKKRKAGNVAQASITFENTKNLLPTEYQTVEITRMLYRSGESEYRLNGVTCRLKDIRELLLDTGIGSNSYAIIALGMVDDILQDKDNARRKMFEQAAGIAKYKRHKHETMLKLKNTTADLDRVDDLLFEIEGNLKTLETQARRTKQFKDLKEKYRSRSLELAVRKNVHLNSKNKELSGKIEDEKHVLRDHEAALHKLEAELERIKKDSLDGEKIVSEKQRELNTLIGKIRGMESDKGLLEQRSTFLTESVRKLEKQHETNTARLAEIDQVVTEKAKTLEGASARVEELRRDVTEKLSHKETVQQTYEAARKQRDHFSEAQQGTEEAYMDLEKRKAGMVAKIEQNTNLKTGFTAELQRLEEEISRLTGVLAEMQKQADEASQAFSVLQVDEDERRSRIKEVQEEISRQKDAIHATSRAMDSKQNECDLIEEMIEKLEGYPESIKFLSKSDAWGVKVPLLSDLVYTDPAHRAKVEYILAPYLNHFVVDSAEDAVRAVQLLTNAQKGRAQFFVLDRCKPVEGTGATPPGATSILEYLEYDAKYAPLVKALLGHVYVTEGAPTDAQYNQDQYSRYTFVDHQGIMFKSGATLSGGSIGLFEGNRLGRAKNLEHLKEEIIRLKGEQTKLREGLAVSEEELAKLQRADRAADLDQLRRQVSGLDKQLAESQAHLRNAEAGRVSTQARMAETEKLLDEVAVALETAQHEAQVLKEKLEHSAAEWDDLDADYHRLLNAFSEASTAHQEAHLAYVQQCNVVENLENEIAFRKQQTDELSGQIARDHEQRTGEVEAIADLASQIEDLSNQLMAEYEVRKEKEEDLSVSEQQYFQGRNIIHDMEEKIRAANKQHQQSQNQINELKEEHNEVKLKLAGVSERLQIEFQTTLEEIQDLEFTDEIDLEELDQKVERMRKRIENFGEINPMALEAFEEMKSRYDAIQGQRQDILDAKQTLLDTIREIDDTATLRFTEAFEKIRAYFIDVFRHLFTEDDSCDLILLDPSRPLESEIEIMAKPKGKRPKSLSQLSGGEKTLTAIALLFSLYLLKPAPFCVFDEVDAPLDDANIQKFNKIIKNFSRDSQFVIVTHNKQTMAAVDIIYGVYMEEQGISNLSPVDFRFLKHEAVLEEVEA